MATPKQLEDLFKLLRARTKLGHLKWEIVEPNAVFRATVKPEGEAQEFEVKLFVDGKDVHVNGHLVPHPPSSKLAMLIAVVKNSVSTPVDQLITALEGENS